MNLVRPLIAMVVSTVVFTSTGGCQTTTQNTDRGALLGALIGAGTGAAIGDGHHAAGPGALIGAGVGAITGAAIGNNVDNQIDRNRVDVAQQYQQQAINQQAAIARAGAVSPEDVIAMTRAGLSEQVIAGQIRASGVTRKLQVNDLIYLRNQGVPDGAIQALQSAQVTTGAAPVAVAPQPTYYAPAPSPVVVEHVYAPPPYYWGPPRGWYYPPHHHHYHGPSPRVSWGISFSR